MASTRRYINIDYNEKGKVPSNATKDGENKRAKSHPMPLKMAKPKKTQANSRGFGRLTPLFAAWFFWLLFVADSLNVLLVSDANCSFVLPCHN